MGHWKRFMYAFFLSVSVIGVLTVVEMILAVSEFQTRIGEFVYSEYFFVPLLVVAYLVTPLIARRMKLD